MPEKTLDFASTGAARNRWVMMMFSITRALK